MIRRFLITIIFAFTIGPVSSCVEDLPQVSEIKETRLIGARVDVPDDPTLAWPIKGETATVSWQIVFPKLETTTDAVESMFIVCTPAPVNITPPLCLEFFELMDKRKGLDQDISDLIDIERLTCEQLVELQSEQTELFDALTFELLCVEGAPSFEISIPEDPKADELLVLGVVCDRGKAFFDPSRESFFGCELEDGGAELKAYYFVPLQPEDVPANHHPSLQDAAFRLDDQRWPKVSVEDLRSYVMPDDSDRENFDCERAVADGVLLEVENEKQIFVVEFEEESLEQFDVNDEPETEELKISHFVTAGSVARPKSVVRREWEFLGFDVEWEPPEKIPKKGLFTRVFFTVRDGRGGFDSAMRAFCVTGE